MSFAGILGQTSAVRALESQLRSGRVAHAYLFTGPHGVGKKAAALALARGLNCERPGECADSACRPCQKISKGIHSDVQVIDKAWQAALRDEEPEEQRTLKIETIREALHILSLKPVEGKRRVLILDEAETITPEAGNAFLKTLEEPPPSAVLVLLSVEYERLLSTIRSRCQRVRFSPLNEKLVAQILGKNGVEKALAQTLAQISEGSVSAAMAYREAEDAGLLTEARAVWQKMPQSEPREALEAASQIGKDRNDVQDFLDRLLLLAKADFRSSGEGEESVMALLGAQDLLKRNAHPQAVLDTLFLKMARLG